MTDYAAPLADMRFVLRHVVDLDALSKLEGIDSADPDVIDAVLEEAGRFMAEVVAPLNRVGDREGSRIENGVVRTPAGFAAAYRQFVDAGWNGIPFAPEYGGGGLPFTVAMTVQEMLTSANMAFSLCPLLTKGAVELIEAHGSPEQKAIWLPKMISGAWTGTMNLTEPQAGSDVGAVKTRAVPAADGTWRITGSKIFITYGEHDMAGNIVHLVLARTPGAPPGTKGISCFIVPKHVLGADGNPGPMNDLRCVSLEHKLGIHASPTAVMSFGDNGGATGYLIGGENQGMRCMFTMMNSARLSVGLEGLAIAERAYQQALSYARERRQGRPIGRPAEESAPIVQHPDVRRMLMLMRAQIEAMRALLYLNGEALDFARRHGDAGVRAEHQALADLLTPVSKAWSTDLGVEIASLGVQVHGGMGYIEETGAAQHMRDARIAPIYEGTNGIQALDLVARKLPMQGGAVVRGFLGEMRTLDGALAAAGDQLESLRGPLADGIEALEEATEWMLAAFAHAPNRAAGGATPYLRLFGIVTGGWLMGRQAVAAAGLLAKGEGDAAFLKAKIATARFYAEQILSQAEGLLIAATLGADALDALPEEMFRS